MTEPKIPFTVIAARLEQAIHTDVGLHGLHVLLCGWQRKRRLRGFGRINFTQRAKDDKELHEPYLFQSELVSFGKYAGYDLTFDNVEDDPYKSVFSKIERFF